MSTDRMPQGSAGQDATPRSRREQTRRLASLVLIALAILFAVLNLDTVRVHWIIATTRTPLIVVIAVSFLAGAALMWLIGRRQRKRA